MLWTGEVSLDGLASSLLDEASSSWMSHGEVIYGKEREGDVDEHVFKDPVSARPAVRTLCALGRYMLFDLFAVRARCLFAKWGDCWIVVVR